MEIKKFNSTLYDERSHLLHKNLRPDSNLYPIEREYPIVLDPLKSHLSICVLGKKYPASESTIIAHANLWPRKLVSLDQQKSIPVGLIGNVATSPSFQGQGVMKKLFENLQHRSESLGLKALFLWSDLLEFYHKLDFESCGLEWRFDFSCKKLKNLKISDASVFTVPEKISLETLAKLMKIRVETKYTLERSLQEFRKLLEIPDTVLMLKKNRTNGEIISYCLIGKGCDLVGYIHEWGGTPADILSAMQQIALITDWEQVGLLAPQTLADNYFREFEPFVLKKELATMALVKEIGHQKINETLKQTYIWGLDSI